jgi:hypothetical protein
MATQPGDAGNRGSKAGSAAIDRNALDVVLTVICDWALRLGALALILSVVYLAYGRFSGPGAGAALSEADRARFYGNYLLALRLLVWGMGLAAAAIAYLYRAEQATGYALAIVGALVYFGIPSTPGIISPVTDPAFARATAAAGVRGGLLCLVPAALAILYDASFRVREVWTGRRRSKTVAVSSDAIVMEKLPGPPMHCWQTHYCRPAVRELCPRFTENTPCWRRKEGCFCEEQIALRAAALKEGSQGVYQNVRKSLDGGPGRRILSPAEKRQRCRVCPIYAEHQRFKYKILVPTVFVVTGALMWFGAGWLKAGVDVSLTKLDTLMAQFSFTAGKAAGGAAQHSLPPGLTQAMDSGIVFVALIAFLSILVLTWLLRLVEYLIFKVQV